MIFRKTHICIHFAGTLARAYFQLSQHQSNYLHSPANFLVNCLLQSSPTLHLPDALDYNSSFLTCHSCAMNDGGGNLTSNYRLPGLWSHQRYTGRSYLFLWYSLQFLQLLYYSVSFSETTAVYHNAEFTTSFYCNICDVLLYLIFVTHMIFEK